MNNEQKTPCIYISTIPFRLAMTLLVVSGSAQALTPVDPVGGCPQTLSTPGEYVLTGDLECSGAVNGVIITAGNVVFHLAGHTISNTAICSSLENLESVGIFVAGGISSVRVDGGKVSGFNDGVLLSSSNSRVEGMTVTNACVFGILGQGRNNRIEKNSVTASGDGVALVPAYNTRVTSNDLSSNVRAGIAISDFASRNLIENNILNNNGTTGEGYGVAIINGHGNIVRYNAINKNNFGIRLGSAVKRNGTPGLQNSVIANTVNGNSKLGIWIQQIFGAPSTIKFNTVLGNGNGDPDEADMFDENAGCGGNNWVPLSNTFQTDQVAGLPDGGPGVGCIR